MSRFKIAALMVQMAAVSAPVTVAAQDNNPEQQGTGIPASVDMAYIKQQWDMRDRFSNPKAEFDFWQQTKDRAQSEPMADKNAAAWVQLRYGISLFYMQEYSKAADELNNALDLGTKAGINYNRFWAELYSYASIAESDRPDKDKAKYWLDKLRKLIAENGITDPYIMPLALNADGYWEFKHGSREAALENACRSADIAKEQLKSEDPLRHANAMNCGVFHFYLDRPETVPLMEAAANDAFANLPPNHTRVGHALNLAAAVAGLFGKYHEAEQLYRRQMELELQNFGTDSPNIYDPASQIASMLAQQGKIEDAIEMQRQVVDLADNLKGGGDFRQRGYSRSYLAALMGISGIPRDALSISQQGLDLLRKQFPGGHPSVSMAEIELGYLMANYGDASAAMAIADAGLQKLKTQLPADHNDLATANIRHAFIMAKNGRTKEAMVQGWQVGTGILSRFSRDNVRRSNIASLTATLTSNFSVLAEIAMIAGDKDKLVEALQIANASDLTLANRAAALKLAAETKGLGQFAEKLRENKAKAQALKSSLSDQQTNADYSPAKIDELKAALALAEAEIEKSESELQRQFPEYAALTTINSVPLKDIQANLDAETAIIFPNFLYGKSATIIVTKDDVSWQIVPDGRPELLDARRAVTANIEAAKTGGTFDSDASHRLFRAIFPNALYGRLANKKRLLFPAGGAMGSLPPSVLVTSKPHKGQKADWLIRHKSVAIFTDLSKPTGQRSSKSISFAGLGDPALAPSKSRNVQLASLFRSGKVDAASVAELPSLPGAGEELRQVQSALQANDSALLTGANFTEEQVKAFDFSDYTVISFATHGLTSGELSGLNEPALVLTPPALSGGNNGSDGLLTASEIALLNIPADWVILSACNSGAGRSGAVPQYSGLARAFRMAGAKSLLLTHWQLRDDIAARLTVDTIKNASEGMPKAEALRQAQLALIDSGTDNPALWAPFILIEN